jgi:class 3 adenylate cyclase
MDCYEPVDRAATLLQQRGRLTYRTSRRAPEDERKQVTVLFADLKDSTELIRDWTPQMPSSFSILLST